MVSPHAISFSVFPQRKKYLILPSLPGITVSVSGSMYQSRNVLSELLLPTGLQVAMKRLRSPRVFLFEPMRVNIRSMFCVVNSCNSSTSMNGSSPPLNLCLTSLGLYSCSILKRAPEGNFHSKYDSSGVP